MRWQRSMIIALLLIAFLVLVGASYETLASRSDIEHDPRPRHLVGAGKIRLNLYCTGKGSPTILLEAGLGDSLDSLGTCAAGDRALCSGLSASYDPSRIHYSDPGLDAPDQ